MQPALQFDAVTKQYRGLFGRKQVRALDGFSLEVRRGEIFGFLGPNGAGKTTAIHIALGLMRPTSGHGRMLDAPFGDARTRRRVGFLAENVAMYHRPAVKLVRFFGGLNGVPEPELSRRSRELLERLDLGEVMDRKVNKFSRGMLQRVGLAQALVNDPELVILDEPTSALDPLGRVQVRELLLELKAQGKTVFLSSHLLSEVEAICDRVAILNRGRVARLGTMNELLEKRDSCEILVRGLRPEQIGGVQAVDGTVMVRVPLSAQRETVEKTWALGGEIVSVNPARRSLEQIFLELANGESQKH